MSELCDLANCQSYVILCLYTLEQNNMSHQPERTILGYRNLNRDTCTKQSPSKIDVAYSWAILDTLQKLKLLAGERR